MKQAELQDSTRIPLINLTITFSRTSPAHTTNHTPKDLQKNEKAKISSELYNFHSLMQSEENKLHWSMIRKPPVRHVTATSANLEQLPQDVSHAVGQVRLYTDRIQL